jgi:hypothetical protein
MILPPAPPPAALLADRASWPARLAMARTHVESAHDWARNAMRYRDVYQKLAPHTVINPLNVAA